MSTKISNNIQIFSWNLCVGCLDNNINDAASRYIIQKCINNSKHNNYYCAEKIISILRDIIKKYDIDIYAFQEQSNRQQFREQFKNLFNNNYEQHNYDGNYITDKNEIVYFRIDTYYNKKYKLLRSDYKPLNTKGKGYTILKLHDPDTNKEFIFINLHNSYEIDSKTLSQNINSNNIETELIIIAGDFTNKYEHWDKKIKINKSLYSNIKPPNTCYLKDNFTNIGDYVISTYGATNIILDLDYTLTSDHKPIIGSVPLFKSFNFLDYDNANDWYDIPDNFYLKELKIKDFKKIVERALFVNKNKLLKITKF